MLHPKRHQRRALGTQDGMYVFADLEPTEIDVTDGDTIYARWTAGTDAELILRRQLTGTVWHASKASGLWADRATLTYVPIEMGG